MADAREPTEPERLIKHLRKQLQGVTLERDDLQKDVESLCMQVGGGGAMWDGNSYVLSERLASAEGQVRKLKRDLIDLGDERDGYMDQVVEVGQSRRWPAPASCLRASRAAAAAGRRRLAPHGRPLQAV
jgi:hypothetical protein